MHQPLRSRDNDLSLLVPVDRIRGLIRGLSWSVPAAVIGAISVPIYINLDFRTTAVSNGLVQAAMALVASPLPILAAICGFQSLRWMLLAAWPQRLGVFANADRLILKLGAFGSQEFNTDRLDVRYPFELIEESEEEATFEAYLPEEEQIARFLPRLMHPASVEPINRTILRFAGGTEADVAARLLPMVQLWRSTAAASSGHRR